jgi:hypothetical protein
MVFDATFNNISAISWRSVLLVEEGGCPERTTDLSQVTEELLFAKELLKSNHIYIRVKIMV